MANVEVRGITKKFRYVTALDDVSFDVKDGEFFVLLGPTGAGKTTALRVISGLTKQDRGSVLFDGEPVDEVTPADRDTAFVFQQYSLYPAMTVYENLAFPLRSPMRKMPEDQIKIRASETAEILRISHLLDRKTENLSGGEMQRVSIGRAIVRQPRVFLMDEPLSNLDAKLRESLRVELQHIQKTQGSTTLFVTHDQVEAMTMATRIAVINEGILQQIDSPQILYDRPNNLFVASFIGSPSMNFFPATLQKDGNKLIVDAGSFTIRIPENKTSAYQAHIGKEVVFGIRPENIHDPKFVPPGIETSLVKAKVDVTELMGNEIFIHFMNDTLSFIARIDPRSTFRVSEQAEVAFDTNNFHIFDANTKKAIR